MEPRRIARDAGDIKVEIIRRGGRELEVAVLIPSICIRDGVVRFIIVNDGGESHMAVCAGIVRTLDSGDNALHSLYSFGARRIGTVVSIEAASKLS